ncbi:MAG: tetratricopeptide repeat protein [Pseudomonadota bacterium]
MSPTAAFILAAGILAVLALGYVLMPLWRRRPVASALAVGVLAVTAGALYVLVGTPRALDPAQARTPRTLAEAIVQLEAEVRREPDQAEAWRLLGRAYTAENRRAEARDALARAARLRPQDPDALVEAAEARAQASPQLRFDAEAVALLRRALEVQPQHQRARWFLGIALRQAGRAAEAASTWEPLLAAVPPQTAARLREQIDLARADAGLPPLPRAAAEQALTVRVALDPAFAARMPEGATLFVIARQPGAPMPVAVEKRPARGFPLELTLDDGDGPMPTARLSSLQEVEVLARLSRSGDAARQAGDVESAPVRVRLPARAPVELVLGR